MVFGTLNNRAGEVSRHVGLVCRWHVNGCHQRGNAREVLRCDSLVSLFALVVFLIDEAAFVVATPIFFRGGRYGRIIFIGFVLSALVEVAVFARLNNAICRFWCLQSGQLCFDRGDQASKTRERHAAFSIGFFIFRFVRTIVARLTVFYVSVVFSVLIPFGLCIVGAIRGIIDFFDALLILINAFRLLA